MCEENKMAELPSEIIRQKRQAQRRGLQGKTVVMGVWTLSYTYTTQQQPTVEVTEDIIAPSESAAEAIIKSWAYECNFTNLKFKTAKLKEKIELI